MNKKKDEKFDFWNDHSLEFLEMAMKRDFQETVQACDGYGKRTRDCGDTLEFFLKGNKDRLETISYDLKGCLFSHACANTIIKLAQNQPVEVVKKIKPQQIIAYLKTLPKAEYHCADHALAAFLSAIEDLEKK